MTETRDKRVIIRLGRWEIPVPATKRARLALGWALTAAGVLPIVGWGFLPLGLMVLSVDSLTMRRLRRRLVVWWERRNRQRQPSQNGERLPAQKDEGGPKRKGRE